MSDIKENVRVALYARVSTEEQREGQTIESQVAELEQFAKDQQWAVAGVFKDEGWSGGVLERPALDRLRDAASRGSFDTVLINDVDRLARNVMHLGIIKKDLERRSARVVFKKLPAENSPTHNLMVNILGSFAEFERELIADRTRRGKRYKVEVRGEYLGSNPPYGFRYISRKEASGNEGYLEINPPEAEIVRQMYYWVAVDGLSTRSVVKRLNAGKIVPRKGGDCWQGSSVRRILRSETYAGVWHFGKSENCEPEHPSKHRRYRRTVKTSVRARPRTEWIPVSLPAHLCIIKRDQWLSEGLPILRTENPGS